jgi:eukaryotic-like serine/threonine-protein kinase
MPTATFVREELLTSPGTTMGTVAYMSPEQVRGEDLDARSDIFSFGLVLYEMATGVAAFAGNTSGVIHEAILNRAPLSPLRLNPELPPKFEEIVFKALEKDPEMRTQNASDLRTDLKRLKRDTDSGRSAATQTTVGADLRVHPTVETMSGTHRGAPLQDSGSTDRALAVTLARRHRKGLVAAIGATLIVIAALAYLFRPALPPPWVSGYTQLTNDAAPKWMAGTDGSRLYLEEQGHGLFSWPIAQVSVAGGEVAPISTPSPDTDLLRVSPDGADLLVRGINGPATLVAPLWVLPVLGGSARRLGNTVGNDAAWSPDGQKLLFANGNELFLAQADGTATRKLLSLSGLAYALAWSPDGSEIRFTLIDPKTQLDSIWQVSAEGAGLHAVLPGWDDSTGECCGSWMPDGKYFVFQSQGQIWARRETGSFLHKVSRAPVELTSGAISYFNPLPSKDGSKLFAVAGFRRGELERYDAKTKTFGPYLGGMSAQDVSYSKDGQWIAYVSFPEGTLWRSKLDGSEKVQLSFPPLYALLPRWSPDGKQILFYDVQSGQPSRIYLVSADGGTPQELLPNGPIPQADPMWSPDGGEVVFSGQGSGNGTSSAIHILDMKTHQVSTLPGSEGLFSPRWSPDGRYILALTQDQGSLMLFDVKTQKWSSFFKGGVGYPCWSANGEYIYFLLQSQGVMREDVKNHIAEQVISLKGFQMTGYYPEWLALAPDDSPLLLKDTGTQEIVSMAWHEP